MKTNIGILGIGSHLPEEVRTNDWWPESVVSRWAQTAIDNRPRIDAAIANATTPWQRAVLTAMVEANGDPFRGVQQRHILPKGKRSSEMEIEAARAAIARAGIAPAEIDFLLVHSMVPDDLLVRNSYLLHQTLGLRDSCFSTSVDGTCNSFLVQLTVAENFLAGGRAKKGLLVQSCALSRLIEPEDPQSAWFGDGATAVVVGAVAENSGVLGRSTITDSKLRNAVVIGSRDREWYEGAPSVFYASDRKSAYEVLLGFADYARRVVHEALADAGLKTDDVDFFASHQAQLWQRRVAQEASELRRAKSLDTFAWAGNLGASNVPLVLECAQREGLLRAGDVVAMYGGGAGVTVSGAIARWV